MLLPQDYEVLQRFVESPIPLCAGDLKGPYSAFYSKNLSRLLQAGYIAYEERKDYGRGTKRYYYATESAKGLTSGNKTAIME